MKPTKQVHQPMKTHGMMTSKLVLLTVLLLSPLATLQASDKPAESGLGQFQGVAPDKSAPAFHMDWLPKFIPNPSSTESHNRAKRTCSGVPSIAVTPGGRLWAAWFSGTTPGAKVETCPNVYAVVSTSADGGKTWKELLLVKHFGIDVDLAAVGKKQRRERTAFISKDDGRAWSNGLDIDERVGCSYPDAQQSSDGTICVTWDFNRSTDQEILLTTFWEEDVLASSDTALARVKANRRLVSKGGVQ